MKKVLIAVMILLGMTSVALVQPVGAASDLDDDICNDISGDLADVAGCNTDKRGDEVANSVIEIVIGLIGVLAVFVMIYGGFIFLTSTGDASKVAKGRNILIYGVVGLVVAILAYAIVKFVGGVIGR